MLPECSVDTELGTDAGPRLHEDPRPTADSRPISDPRLAADPSLAVLSNAGSRANRNGRWSLLALSGLNGPHEVTHDVTELPAALDELLAARPDALAINGGDGTLQTLLSECARRGVLDALPPLAVLPGGTTNMSAHDLSGLARQREALRAFAALRGLPREAWPVTRRPVVEVHTGDGRRFAGLFFGLGTVVRGVELWQQALRRRSRAGDLGVAVAVGRAMWGIARRKPPFDEATPVTLRFDGEPPTDTAVSALMVTTLERLVLRMRPYWGDGAGPLTSTWMEARPRRLLRHLPPLLWGRASGLPDDGGYHSRRATCLTIGVDDPWLLDGEVLRAPGPLTVVASPPLPFLDLRRCLR